MRDYLEETFEAPLRVESNINLPQISQIKS